MKPSILRRLSVYLLPALSGVMMVLLFPPFNLHLLAWIALVPLLVAMYQKPPTQAFKMGLATGTIYFGGVMPWIINVLMVYGHINIILGLLFTLLLVFYLSLYMGVFAWAIGRMGKTEESLLYAPFLLVILEYARGHLLEGLPWAFLAHSQHTVPAVIQVASITGTAGVTFLVTLVNATIAYAILKRKEGVKAIALPAGALALLLLNLAWGYSAIEKINGAKGEELKVALIQGNIDQSQKWDPQFRDMVTEKYFAMTRDAAKERPDLVVWPETALPFFYGLDDASTQKLKNLIKEISLPILFGSLGAEPDAKNKSYRYFNRAFLVTPGGREDFYDKGHLVPFGEYVPFRRWLTFIEKITDAVPGDVTAGTKNVPMWINGISTGVQICYEIIFAEPSREFRRNGASLMVNITNDAWFGRLAASAQHMMSIPFRAVENRMPIVRAANTGISGFVTATGEIKKTTKLFEATWVMDNVKVPMTGKTFYTRFGDLFTTLCAAALFVSLLMARLRRKQG